MPKLEFVRGDTEEIELIVTDLQDNVQDITGWEFWLTVKKLESDEDSEKVLQKTVGDGIEISDASAGKILITVEPEDRVTLKASPGYQYDVQGKDTAGRIVTLARDILVVKPDITHAVS